MKTKVLISCAVTAFVFAYADFWFSHLMAHLYKICFLPYFIRCTFFNKRASQSFLKKLCISSSSEICIVVFYSDVRFLTGTVLIRGLVTE